MDETTNEVKPTAPLKEQQEPKDMAKPKVQVSILVKPILESGMTNSVNAGLIEDSSKTPSKQDTGKGRGVDGMQISPKSESIEGNIIQYSLASRSLHSNEKINEYQV